MSAPTHQQTWIIHVCSSCCFCSAYWTHLSLLLLRSCRWCLSLDLDRDRRECLLRLLSLSLDLDLDLRGMLVKSSAQDQESMPMLHCAERHGVKTLKTGTMATHAAELSSTFTRVRNHSPTRLCTQRGSPCHETGSSVPTLGLCSTWNLPKAWLPPLCRAIAETCQVRIIILHQRRHACFVSHA